MEKYVCPLSVCFNYWIDMTDSKHNFIKIAIGVSSRFIEYKDSLISYFMNYHCLGGIEKIVEGGNT